MRRLVCLAGLVLLAACAPRQRIRGAAGPNILDWSGKLESSSGSGVRGAVAARSGYAQTGVSITIAGARPGSRHPWHIHRGTCGSDGPIVGAASAYPVLEVNSRGDASGSTKLAVALSPRESYYVDIHASPTDLRTILACGQIHP